MTTTQPGVDGVPLTPPTRVDLRAEPLEEGMEFDPSALDEGIKQWIESKFVPREQAEKDVAKVKSVLDRRAEEERQARLRVEKEYEKAVGYNQQWQQRWEELQRNRLTDASPEEQVKFYKEDAERTRKVFEETITKVQQHEVMTQQARIAEEMWHNACEEATRLSGVPISTNDPGALEIRKRLDYTNDSWQIPFRLVEYASSKSMDKDAAVADANKVPPNPPSGGRRRSAVKDFNEGALTDPVKIEELISKARAGLLK